MRKFIIREFKIDDKNRLIELFLEFGNYLKNSDANDMGLLIVPENYGQVYSDKLIKDVTTKRGIIYVLEVNSVVAGFIGGIIFDIGRAKSDIDCKPHRMGRVTDLFISQKYRGKGYGSILLTKMEEYFKSKKCFKVNIEVFAPNVDAYNFYLKHGYTDRNIDLGKKL